MALQVGSRLAHYDVTALIGEGGMGQVYQATDTKLNRQVALKILPEAFAEDRDRLARFQREAQVLASLNHPGIAAIYGLEESDDTRALVLELVEGPTLADRIAQGPIPVDEALPIAKQIAEALEAAHAAGVIHRDLKPANIKVRDDGTVKVLDFGLAKALDTTPEGDPSLSPTLTAAATQMGVILGTAAYMSPEQARGKPVDKRADIWAFGVVLYEMLTGSRPFQGEDVSLTLASVMKSDVNVTVLPADLPETLRTVVRQCLQKDPKQRVADMQDVRLAMEGAFETPVSEPSQPIDPSQFHLWRRPVPLALTMAAVALLTGLGVWSLTRQTQPEPRDLVRLVVPTQGPLTLSQSARDVAVSPDGRHIVYATGISIETRQLYLQPLDQLEATPIRGTERASHPIFSPGGESVGFREGGTIKSVSISGGPATTIIEADGTSTRGISWGPDDTIVFATNASQGLMRVPSVGGDAERLTTVNSEQGETDHFWPEALPNGKGVLFTVWSGSADNSRIAVVSLETNQITDLIPRGNHPRYSPTGHLVYGEGGTLWAVGFDAERLKLTTDNPVPVVEDMNTKPRGGTGNFSVSATGTLVYVSGGGGGGGTDTLVMVDRQGNEEPLDLPPNGYVWPRLSPEGTELAVSIRGGDEEDVWTSDVARSNLTPLTIAPETDGYSIWTLEGQEIVFASRRDGGQLGLFSKRAEGTGPVEPLMMGETIGFLMPYSWSPDGLTLAFGYMAAGTDGDIGVFTREDGGWHPLLETASDELHPAISPTGAWFAYTSDVSGRQEIYVDRFPDLGDRETISTGGGRSPHWSPTGDELFYRRLDGAMMVVPIDTSDTAQGLTPGTPEMLFEGSSYVVGGRPIPNYDLSPNGEQFLMVKAGVATSESETAEIIWVQNWFEELTERVPVP
jgi:serine/threonine-protein kinase